MHQAVVTHSQIRMTRTAYMPIIYEKGIDSQKKQAHKRQTIQYQGRSSTMLYRPSLTFNLKPYPKPYASLTL